MSSLNLMELASYLPKLEKLASSLSGNRADVDVREPPNVSRGRTLTHPSRRAPPLQKSAPPTSKSPKPRNGSPVRVIQPGWVYVPASWVKKKVPLSRQSRSNDATEGLRKTILDVRRASMPIQQNVLVQKKSPYQNATNGGNKTRAALEKPTTVSATKAALVLEKKRVEFLKYLQEVQADISGLAFVKPERTTKSALKTGGRADSSPLKRKVKKALQPKSKTRVSSRKEKIPKASQSGVKIKTLPAKVVAASDSLTSMLTQESSSEAQIRMMDDAFNRNHRKVIH